jgi:6-phosphogluconate dehydrogenase
MTIIVQGLGRMGMQIARKLSENGHQVIALNRSPEPVAEAEGFGAKGSHTKEEALQELDGAQAVVWIMLPADIIDVQLDEWLAIVPKGSLLVDGGNSPFQHTQERFKKVTGAGSTYMDVGTSGGVHGYDNGFCMMAGGEQSAFAALEPVLKTLAAPSGAYQYFGPSGSGHYVKMVHNAIEYGMMESLAEGYRMLKEGPYKSLDLAAAGQVWQHGSVIVSWLNELSRQALAENPTLDGIEGFVAENGEARWTLELAKELGIPLPAIQSALDVRIASQNGTVTFATKLLAAMRNKFGGHQLNK